MQKMQCSVCGSGALVMDGKGEFATCEHCGMKYDRNAINRILEVFQGYDTLVKNAETFLSLHEYGKAWKIFGEITDKYPDRARGWWGLAECYTNGFKQYCDAYDVRAIKKEELQTYYERAIRFATENEKAHIVTIFDEYQSRQAKFDIKRENEKNAAERRSHAIAELGNRIQDIQKYQNFLEGKVISRKRNGAASNLLSIIAFIAAVIIAVNAGIISGVVFFVAVAIVIAIITAIVKAVRKGKIKRLQKQIELLRQEQNQL